MRSTAQLRSVWATPCQLRPSARFTFWSGVPVTVDGRIVPALRVLDDCLRRHNYRPVGGQTWGYNCRKITGGSGYSLHAYGIAVDINSLANPYGPRLVTDMPMAMVEEIEAIRTNGGHRVWGWGGRYARNKDAMHIEVVASPAELATGIASTERTAPAQSTFEEDDMATPVTVEPGKDLFWVIDGPGLSNAKRFTWLSVIAQDAPTRTWIALGNKQGTRGGWVDVGEDRYALEVQPSDDKLLITNHGAHRLGVSLVTSPR